MSIAVHVITAIDYFKDHEKVTSNFLAGSVGANPVIVRNVMGNLKEAGIIDISQGKIRSFWQAAIDHALNLLQRTEWSPLLFAVYLPEFSDFHRIWQLRLQ